MNRRFGEKEEIMSINEKKCPVCKQVAIVNLSQDQDAYFVNCHHCGRYFIDNNTFENNSLSLKVRSCILFYLTQKWNDKKLTLYFHNYDNLVDGKVENKDRYNVAIKNLLNLYPVNISEKIDMILLNIANRIKYIGNTFITNFSEENEKLFADFFIDDFYGEESLNTQFDALVNTLEELGMIKQIEDLGDLENSYTLTASGWNRVQELQLKDTQLAQAFIAMWFDNSMIKARQSIANAISDCGYVLSIIDDKEHNHQIVPEIFYEIKQSSFVIADLTGQRTGVYYEAGYAEALGKEVILTCREDSFNDRHFDVAQKNTIVWKDENDLYQRLIKRIESTIGARR